MLPMHCIRSQLWSMQCWKCVHFMFHKFWYSNIYKCNNSMCTLLNYYELSSMLGVDGMYFMCYKLLSYIEWNLRIVQCANAWMHTMHRWSHMYQLWYWMDINVCKMCMQYDRQPSVWLSNMRKPINLHKLCIELVLPFFNRYFMLSMSNIWYKLLAMQRFLGM